MSCHVPPPVSSTNGTSSSSSSPAGSATATETSPAAIPERRPSRSAEGSTKVTNPAPSTALPTKLLHADARPSSSSTTAASAKVAPAPPSESGTSSPSQPDAANSDRASTTGSAPVVTPRQQLPGHGAQLFVELTEVGAHGRPPGSLGRPSPRSAMIVRWTSLVPPGIVHSQEPTKSSIQAPDSQPLERGLVQLLVRPEPVHLRGEVHHPLQQLAVAELDHRGVGGTRVTRLVAEHES